MGTTKEPLMSVRRGGKLNSVVRTFNVLVISTICRSAGCGGRPCQVTCPLSGQGGCVKLSCKPLNKGLKALSQEYSVNCPPWPLCTPTVALPPLDESTCA